MISEATTIAIGFKNFIGVKGTKLDNPARKAVWDSVRKLREADQSDGSVTRLSIARMKRGARLCAYCGCTLHRKQTDHMIPLALGGEHSLRNIVIVCPDCNQRKHALSYEEWIERVDPKHRDRVVALMRVHGTVCGLMRRDSFLTVNLD